MRVGVPYVASTGAQHEHSSAWSERVLENAFNWRQRDSTCWQVFEITPSWPSSTESGPAAASNSKRNRGNAVERERVKQRRAMAKRTARRAGKTRTFVAFWLALLGLQLATPTATAAAANPPGQSICLTRPIDNKTLFHMIRNYLDLNVIKFVFIYLSSGRNFAQRLGFPLQTPL